MTVQFLCSRATPIQFIWKRFQLKFPYLFTYLILLNFAVFPKKKKKYYKLIIISVLSGDPPTQSVIL